MPPLKFLVCFGVPNGAGATELTPPSYDARFARPHDLSGLGGLCFGPGTRRRTAERGSRRGGALCLCAGHGLASSPADSSPDERAAGTSLARARRRGRVEEDS